MPSDCCNCCAYNCLNTTENKPQYSFFSIPQTDPDRRNLWLQKIGRQDLIEKPITSRTRRVCEEHFAPEFIIYTNNRKILKRAAVPTLNLQGQAASDQNIIDLDPSPSTSVMHSASKLTQTEHEDDTEITQINTTTQTQTVDYFGKTNSDDENTFHQLCDKHLPKELAQLVKTNHNLIYKSTGEYQEYQNFCINLYQTSPQVYHFLQNILCLPTTAKLINQYLKIGTQVGDGLMMTLKTRVDKMTAKEKNCSVLIGSMSLKAHLCYNIKEDKIIGFQEIAGVQYPGQPSTRALVLMIRGIFSNWKLPISYAFVPENGYEDKLDDWIGNLLKILFEIGLNVRSFVSAVEDDWLRDVIKSLDCISIESIETPYFCINNRKIYHIFDAPDLMMSLRNCLVSNNFHYQENMTKFEFIKKFFNEDQKKTLPIAGKLTKSHINPTTEEKREIKYAAQLLSRTVANGLWNYIAFKRIEEAGVGTAEFIAKINVLFDMLNASKRRNDHNENKKAYCGEETQRFFFIEMLDLFQSLNVINLTNGEDVTSTTKFVQGFLISIKAIMLLFDDFKEEGYNFLPTKNLQVEALNTFFKQMSSKNKKSTQPTPQQFTSAFRKLFYLYHKKFTLEGNSKGELSKLLALTDDLDEERKQYVARKKSHENPMTGNNPNPSTNDENVKIVKEDYNQIDTPEKHTLFYVCAYLLTRYRNNHNCQSDEVPERILSVPYDFVELIEKMDQKFVEALQCQQINHKIAAHVYNKIKDIRYSPPCPCFPKTYVIKLFIRIRIFYTIRANNREFQKCSLNYFSVPKL